VAPNPRIYFRPENGDAAFIAALAHPAAPFDAAIVAARYLAPYVVGGPHGDPDALPDALASRNLQFIVDPGTPELAMPSFKTRASERHRQSPIAAACQLPLEIAALTDQGARNYFVEVVLSTQTRAGGLVPPHLEVQARDNGELSLNLQMLEQTVASAPDKRVVAFLQCTQAAFRRRVGAAVAGRYKTAGATHVVLRVRGLRNEEMSRADFELYLDVIEAFAREQVELTIDCTGRAGPPLVAGGARGFATGWLHFRSVARRPFGTGGGGSEPGSYEIPGGFADILPPGGPLAGRECSVPACRAHEADADPSALRLHFFHVLREQATLAAALGGRGYGERLRGVGGYAAAWGSALVERARRAA
jgi:hypothetical protein